MDPSFIFRHWSKKNIGILMKSTATIEDVDGECSFKVSGIASKSCPIAAHYRVALRAINKKFGLYRKIVIHLTDSRNNLAIQLRDTYLSVMDYMHNVRIAFFVDARDSADPLEAGFRSPALDYYLWLDHKVGGFHDRSRETLEKDHNVTLRSLQNRECEDIIALLDWSAYHMTNCHEHDLCGAFQGCVSEEDLQKLLHAVDCSMDGSTVAKVSRSPTPVHSMDQPHQKILVTDTTQVDSQIVLDPVDTVMNTPLAPNESASIAISGSRDKASSVNQKNELSDVANDKSQRSTAGDAVECDTCVTHSDEIAMSEFSPTSVLKPFPLPFDWVYCKRALRTMGVRSTRVDISRWLIAHIVVRLRELHGLDEDTPLDDALQKGSVTQATYQEYCELYGMSHFLNATQTIPQERQSMAQFFISAARGFFLSSIHVDCAVQCDSEACGTPVDYIAEVQPTVVDAKYSTGQWQIQSHGGEPVLTLDFDNPCLSAADWMLAGGDISDHQSAVHTSHITHPSDMLTDTPSDTDSIPLTRLRSRTLKNDKPTMPSKNDVDFRPSLGRPVVFAATRQRAKKKARIAMPSVANYTIEDLMSSSQINSTAIPPVVASALMTESLSEAVSTAASSFMRIELWLRDVALECKDALETKDMLLSPLAHNVLLELSTRASHDASSLKSDLENYVSDNSTLKYVMTVIQFLCKLRLSKSGADIQYEAGFRLLATIVKDNQRDIPA
ncbi:hypothetical protein DEU56DRAFT_756339 [Suillus clintonianus]|uniref:uncharacterized protein n=1 Tax=Suillus clintonianus TaxID=1904413 RepID=UPI001B8798A1|nr:uncharacterized protein DEU56DRAFT_756339 [Suillus clintonianus]KAG2136433.1 hypothetical protein DEU56DRAFT_756339 [Suillus clintonianus]